MTARLVRTSMWLAVKDLRIESRSMASLWSAIVLATVAVVVVGLAAPPGEVGRSALIPAVSWVATLYAALLIGDRLETVDREDDARAWLWLTVVDRAAIFLGKVAACTVLLTVVVLWTWLAMVVLLDVRSSAAVPLIAAVSGLVALSTASIVMSTATLLAPATQRSLLLPVIAVPLLIPTSIASVQATRAVLGVEGGALAPWLVILAVEALLFCGVGLLTYELIGGPS